MRMRKVAYVIKCFVEALNLREDFETMGYLVSAYTVANKPEEALEALEVLDRMVGLEPDHVDTRLMRVNLLFLLDRDAEVIAAGM